MSLGFMSLPYLSHRHELCLKYASGCMGAGGGEGRVYRAGQGELVLPPSPDLLTVRHLPESQVEYLEAGQLRDALQAALGDPGTAVQVYASELA